MATNLYQLLQDLVEAGGSDLHITTGIPPTMRLHGEMTKMEKYEVVTPPESKRMAYSILNDAQRHRFEEENELDCSFGVKGIARFRANVFVQRGAVGAVFRVIPQKVPTFDELKLPAVVKAIANKPRGLVLVTGPTGSGKSTSLAAVIDHINSTTHGHIITIEDPIEYLHPHKNCVVNQREVKNDTKDFKEALKRILRQDPDVVLVGELRDLETIEAALTLAETGHLTLGTLHTNSCAQTINRIVDVFPPSQQPQVRAQLALTLEGIVSQQLIPLRSGHGRCMAMEILVPNSAIRNLIREDKIHQIYSSMQTGQDKYGMQTMNQALMELTTKGLISHDDAMFRTGNPQELVAMFGRMGIKVSVPEE
ncbi:MAG: type IV pilus twitching motility protein PilT [Nitrospirota bacterium]|nr:type IV pilus twitching motility protein PilT [Nitrospirota bacterium]